MTLVIPDVSNNNPQAASENWAQVKAEGVMAAACKASEGGTFVDWTFAPNWTQMASAGIPVRIAYHFGHPAQSATGNASAYRKAVGWGGGLRGNDRRALDMEVYEGSAQETVAWALAWESATHVLGGAKPLFYTFLAFLDWLGDAATPLVNVFDLWIADLAPSPPASVHPWSKWALWQYTWSGSLGGIHGQCDLSVVSGSFFQARSQSETPSATGTHLNAPIIGASLRGSTGTGYWLVGGDGGVFSFQAAFYGSTGSVNLNKPIVGIASTPSGHGYWLAAADGGIFSFGDASFHGSLGAEHLVKPIVDIAATSTGKGYWLVGQDGGVFGFGDATYGGSLPGDQVKVNNVTAIVSHPKGGYYVVGSDGGVFAFKAPFFGSTGDQHLNSPIVDMAVTPSGKGYWLVGRDGGVFSFGDADFYGSLGDRRLNAPIIAINPTPSGKGYMLAASDGGVFTFGDMPFHGSA